MSVVEEAGKVAATTITAMQSVPLAIALLAVNAGFIGFTAYLLHEIAHNSFERNTLQMQLIDKLVVGVKDCYENKGKAT